MMRKTTFCMVLSAIVILLSGATLRAETEGAVSPFLIAEGLPHLTKVLMAQWDNSALKLTEAQKEQLLVVRKKTMSAVKKLTPQAEVLRNQVIEGINVGKTPAELEPLVQKLAKLKARATQVHLECIYDTRQILTSEQRDLLGDLSSE
jgi:Spy/CpxP family protein refolding chaperone